MHITFLSLSEKDFAETATNPWKETTVIWEPDADFYQFLDTMQQILGMMKQWCKGTLNVP